MQLSELLSDWPCLVKGSIRVDVLRMQDVAQQVVQGDVFIARKGRNSDGKKWIDQAIANGASVIVVDDEKFFDRTRLPVPIVWVPNCQTFDAMANAKLCGNPAEALSVIAITGTNGKTTVSHFIGQLLTALQQRTMVIGTIGIYENNNEIPVAVESLTTLKPQHLQPLLQQAVRNRIDYVVLEASSMGLAQYRLDSTRIALGIYLNLSVDHIEDHGSMTKYKLAKQRLMQLSEQLIVNQDDDYCRGIGILSRKKKMSFSLKAKADLSVQKIATGPWQTTCCLFYKEQQAVVTLPVVGDYQLKNVAAAVSALLMLGFSLAELKEPLANLSLPPGRMQLFPYKERMVIVDYAHTADALKQLLTVVKEQTTGKITVVFSCGGERDQEKRKEMGLVASQLADYIVLTTDNSRSEDPEKINAQIREGFFALQPYIELLDRPSAIEHAIKRAQVGDAVVIAGKGHETTQIIGNETYPFSDIAYVKELLASLDNEKSSGSSR